MKEQNKEIYLASPLGFSEAGREFYYGNIVPIFEKLGFGILDPWKLTDPKKINRVLSYPYGIRKRNAWSKLNLEIAQNNIDAIERSSGMFAVLDGVDVDSGTASEIGYAAALKKPILGYRGDFRLSADNEGGIVNLQVEGFIRLRGGTIISSISELAENAIKIFGQPQR